MTKQTKELEPVLIIEYLEDTYLKSKGITFQDLAIAINSNTLTFTRSQNSKAKILSVDVITAIHLVTDLNLTVLLEINHNRYLWAIEKGFIKNNCGFYKVDVRALTDISVITELNVLSQEDRTKALSNYKNIVNNINAYIGSNTKLTQHAISKLMEFRNTLKRKDCVDKNVIYEKLVSVITGVQFDQHSPDKQSKEETTAMIHLLTDVHSKLK